MYTVIVGNIGNVEETDDILEAMDAYNTYVGQSRHDYGRAAGETVTLMEGEHILLEYP